MLGMVPVAVPEELWEQKDQFAGKLTAGSHWSKKGK